MVLRNSYENNITIKREKKIKKNNGDILLIEIHFTECNYNIRVERARKNIERREVYIICKWVPYAPYSAVEIIKVHSWFTWRQVKFVAMSTFTVSRNEDVAFRGYLSLAVLNVGIVG